MECTVFTSLGKPGLTVTEIQQMVRYVLLQEKRPGSVSVHLIGDRRMKQLQQQYRGKTTTTDVLSFPAAEGEAMPELRESKDWGDIFLSIPQLRRQAKEWRVSFREEAYRMLVHGTLHLLGYDHIKKSEAKVMFGRQERYLTFFLHNSK